MAVAGAGIGGLTASVLLAQSGHRVALFDQFEAPRPVGSGLVIQPVGQHVLAVAGAATAALKDGQRIRRLLGTESRSGRVVLDVSYGREESGRFGLGIHRASLFDALWTRMQASGTQFTASAEVVSLSSVPDGRQMLHFADGRKEGPFDLVVDAAGSNSP
ncbi:MAG: NAD(P)-binding protein, partial [Pseudomonadota bacterium]